MTAFQEPEPTAKFEGEGPRARWIAQIPVPCVIEARKIDGLDTTSV